MRTLICVAWPYASGPRHLGHAAGAYLPADVVARAHRLAGDEVLMVSGSDCHGTPITVAAGRAGAEPEAFAAGQHARIAASFERLGISFDRYTTTTTSNHERVVHDLLRRLHGNGYVTEQTEESAWCPAEERSLPDRYVEGTCPHCGSPDARGDQCDGCGRTLDPSDLQGPRCGRCGADASFREQRQLFLRLDLLQPDVERFLDTRTGWRPFVLNEARGWLREGLRPRSITRDLPWGVRVPFEGWDDRRIYVWFEAVIGYLSATVEAEPDRWREYWCATDTVHRYFIGKDNGPFHAVWWPAILSGADPSLHLPDDIVANHYLTLGEDKMSASRGVGFAVEEALDAAGVDPVRHALCALSPETQDVAFTWEQADALTRTGLLGDIANPVHRVATLLWKRFGGRVDSDAARAAADEAGGWMREARDAFLGAELRRGLRAVWELGRHVNRVLAETEPWRLPDAEAHAALSRLVPFLDAIGIAAWPVVPETAERIRSTLGRQGPPSSWDLDPTPPRMAAAPQVPLRQ